MAAGSSPVARGSFVAPLPPFEVCYAVIIEAQWLHSRVKILKYDPREENSSEFITDLVKT